MSYLATVGQWMSHPLRCCLGYRDDDRGGANAGQRQMVQAPDPALQVIILVSLPSPFARPNVLSCFCVFLLQRPLGLLGLVFCLPFFCLR